MAKPFLSLPFPKLKTSFSVSFLLLTAILLSIYVLKPLSLSLLDKYSLDFGHFQFFSWQNSTTDSHNSSFKHSSFFKGVSPHLQGCKWDIMTSMMKGNHRKRVWTFDGGKNKTGQVFCWGKCVSKTWLCRKSNVFSHCP